jgi:hypothetical protein
MYQQVVTDIIEWLSCRKFVIKQLVCLPSWMSPVISSISFAWRVFRKLTGLYLWLVFAVISWNNSNISHNELHRCHSRFTQHQQVVTDIIEWLSCRKFVIKQLVCFPSWMSPVISSISFAWQTFSKAMMERNIECCVNLLWHLCSSLCEILLLFHDITANTSG